MARDGYYRQPSLRGETVVFVSEDDLWTVPAAGGIARRLTANPGRASTPALSPDGELLAFTGRDEGQDEVYVMPAAGGPARRLTYLGARTRVTGWTPDGAVVFASDAREPFPNQTRLYRVEAEGGEPIDLGVGHAVALAFGPSGARLLARHAVDLAYWKRYRGGLTGDLWIDPDGDGAWRRLLDLPGNVASPGFLGARVVFVSDHEGTGNLYSCDLDGTDLRRLTDHEDFYVRHPASDGRRVVHQAGADLYLVDPENGPPKRVAIDFRSPRAQRARRFVEGARYLQDADLDATGESVVVTARGRVVSLAPFEGAIELHGDARATRRRLATFLHDGRIVTVSDATGRERLEVYHRGGVGGDPEQVVDGFDIGRPRTLRASPRHPQVALLDHRHRVLLVDLATGEGRTLDRSAHGHVAGLAFSPDGAYLAYGLPVAPSTTVVRLCELATGAVHDVTQAVLRDGDPSFDPEGRFLCFVGQRSFDPVYDELDFDLGFPRGDRLYLVTLQAGTPSPLDPEGAPAANAGGGAAGDRPATEPAAGDGSETPGPTEPPPVRIDLEGIERRVVTLPVPDGRIGRARAAKGRVLFTTFPIEGSLANSFYPPAEPPAKGTLQAFDLAKRETETVMEGVTDFRLSLDASTVLVRAGNRLRRFAAAEKAPPDGKAEPGRASGWVDLARVRVSVDPPAEWEQMLRQAWELQRELFWTEDLSGVDWEGVLERYRPLVDRVGTRNEMSDLLWEVQGELGTSHAYVLGGELPPEPSYPQGFLGADLSPHPSGEGYVVDGIPLGDAWNDAAGSPLDRPGVELRVGDRILAIDGQLVGRAAAPGARLVHRARARVRLTVEPASGGERRDLHVTTLASELALRYRAWVEGRRRRVHEASEGRLGYLHVPDMGPRGFAEFHRGWLLEAHRDGLLVDVRFNGGGHVSELLLEKLARRRVAYVVHRYDEPQPYPQHAVAGPLVAITNERAGSDGDIFSHLFKRLGLGPLVGTRTWGGVVGLSVLDGFVDGGLSTQPQSAFWFDDVGWRVENFGTEPTVPVEITPQEDAAGLDPQLERAIEEGLAALRADPPVRPDLSERPSKASRPLPKSA